LFSEGLKVEEKMTETEQHGIFISHTGRFISSSCVRSFTSASVAFPGEDCAAILKIHPAVNFLLFTIFTKKTMDYSVLSDAPLFKGLTTASIESLLSGIPHRIKKYKSGTMISQSGDPVNSMIVVINGVVKGEMVDYAGRVIKIEDIPAPGALASAFVFGNRNRFPVNAVALSDVEILSIEKPDFLKLLKGNDLILVNFLNMISNRSQFLSEKIKFLNFKTIRGKLAQFILQRAYDDKTTITMDMTQNDLADFFGVARPSVSRALGELEEEGLIEVSGKNIRILNRKGLSALTID
jgi:CRP/FNR family transcriptional regulator, dissimilatory nitrate respiration regulator